MTVPLAGTLGGPLRVDGPSLAALSGPGSLGLALIMGKVSGVCSTPAPVSSGSKGLSVFAGRLESLLAKVQESWAALARAVKGVVAGKARPSQARRKGHRILLF